MITSKIHIERAGMQTTVQDLGRLAYQNLGVPISGAMDQSSHKLANTIVGNEENNPTIEICLLGPKIRFEGTGVFAICGADLSASLNNQAIKMNSCIQFNNKDVLNFGRPIKGCRTYLAVHGKWMAKEVLSSHSYSMFLNGIDVLKRNDSITIVSDESNKPPEIKLDYNFHKIGDTKLILSPGPESDRLSQKDIESISSQEFTIDVDSNRMAYKVSPLIPNYKNVKSLISSAIIPGVVQLNNEGQMIILMRDCQTTGGFPRIAYLSNDEINKVAQLRPGDKVSFIWNL